MNQQEIQLIQKVRSGNQKAIQALYGKYEPHWFRVCLRYGRNRDEAQDIFQEGAIKVFQALRQFDSNRGAFSTWSNRIFVNIALKYLKKYQWQQSFEDLSMVAGEVDWQESIIGRITAKELIELIQQLPSGYRVVFNMYEIEGYTHKEIAAELNISVGTSKSQLFKAKKMLQQKLKVLF